MSNDIYKILEGMDRIKSGHKDQVKGSDKPSKGEKKYDGPYTKHPFQGELVGEVKEDELSEEFDKFDNSELVTTGSKQTVGSTQTVKPVKFSPSGAPIKETRDFENWVNSVGKI
jgi:hypothetical protein